MVVKVSFKFKLLLLLLLSLPPRDPGRYPVLPEGMQASLLLEELPGGLGEVQGVHASRRVVGR